MRRRSAIAVRLVAGLAAAAALLGFGASSALAVAVTAAPPGGATEGAPIAGTVATFTDGVALLGCPAASVYSAQISWGDGTTSAGTVSGGVGSLLGCFYAVAGNHTYPEEGSFTYSVTVSGPNGSGSSPAATLLVHDARLSASGADFSASANMAVATTVATFTDANAGASATDFSAAIAWGDGTSTAGTVAAAATGGGFAVTGSHTYTHTGTFTVSVTINDTGGSQTSVTAKASVLTTASVPPPGNTAPAALRLGVSTPQLARGGTVVVRISCPVAAKVCRGRLTVTTVANRHAKLTLLRRTQTLGTTIFIINGGQKGQLSLRPKQTVVAVLRRAGSVTVVALASSFDSTGRSQVAKLTAKLKLVR